MSQPEPSVGRIVHYVSYGTPGGEYPSVCRAAVITEVPDHLTAEPFDGCPNGTEGQWIAGLAVLNPEGFFFNRDAQHSEEQRGGTWHWPERV
ncbi:hypothetical protein ACIOD1_13065 [Streptomyces sp. NPDC088097]|uniref:hypothetical protein n=1 Tax=Streptomyces sp. NPDC088097 TaxID=3365823 RepID=UPI0037F75A00